jgi:sterol desaturase/sphingolipid hydroxylase (fatty acid hydroxylase superfamily)
MFLTVTTIVINFILALFYKTADWTIALMGILQWLPQIPLWLYVVIGLLLDLIGAYLVHFVEHKTKFLWFHLIHHTDTWVDTSANRHPGESIIYIYHFGF